MSHLSLVAIDNANSHLAICIADVLIVAIVYTVHIIHKLLTVTAALHAFVVVVLVSNQQVEFVSRRLIILIHCTVAAVFMLRSVR